jgi:uncharacterized membrane protein
MELLENHPRTIAKVISWRVLLTISHIVNGFIVTSSWATGLQIAGLAAVINSVLYWSHERGWNFAQWNRKPKDGLLFFEGQPRTISKIITWRVLITASNFLIPFIMTGSWGSAALFLGIATIVNVALFYTHERVWNRIVWGKKIKDEPELQPTV